MANGMTFNSITSASKNLVYAVPRIPILPDTKPSVIEIQGRDGYVDFQNESFTKRIIPVDCLVTASTASDLITYLRAIAVWLTGEGYLYFDHDTTKQWYGKVFNGIDQTRILGTAAMFTAEFECQPYATDVSETTGVALNSATDYGSDCEFYPDINISLYNLINDLVVGDMHDAGHWTPAAATDAVADNVLSVTGDGGNAEISDYADCETNVDQTHKYYLYAKARVTDAVCTKIELKWDGSTGGTAATVDNQTPPAENTWYILSYVGTPADFTGKIRMQLAATYADAATANTKVMQVKECMVIDLTLAFGAGNEPTVATMDGYISTFLTAQADTWFTSTLATYVLATLVSTGEYVRVDDTYANSDDVIIAMSTGKVTKNGTACMDKVSIASLFFGVPTGSQTINITSDGFFIATMDYFKRYLYA